MGLKYLWDTNTVIYYLQQQFPLSAERFVDKTLEEAQPAISVITEIELLCWEAISSKDLQILNNFISETFIFELENSIKIKTIQIRKQYKVKLPDAIIAATALTYGLTLITRNSKDFKNIPELKLVNPFEI